MEITTSAFSKIDPKNLSQKSLNYFLFIAASENDNAGIKYFIDLGADASCTTFYTNVMLTLITHRNHDMICYLLEHDIKKAFHNSYILYRLVEQGMLETVNYLLNRLKSIDSQYKGYFDEAIRIASGNKDYEMIKLFLEYGASLTIENINAYAYASDNRNFNEFAFHFEDNIECLIKNPKLLERAAGCGNIKLVEFLIQNGADCTANNNNALQCACAKWDLKMAKLLIKNGSDCKAKKNYAIRLVAYRPVPETQESLKLLQLLVDNGADCTACEDEALRMAVENKHIKMVTFFLNHGANIAAQNHAALRIAIKTKNLEMVKLLIHHGADSTAYNYKAFITAMKNNYIDIIEYLLNECPLSIDALNSLLLATILYEYPRLEILALLLKFGADPNMDNSTPLKYAINKSSDEIIEVLFNHGATCTEEVFNYSHSRWNIDDEIIALLIKHGAFYTNQAIDNAISYNNYDIMQSLYKNFFTKQFQRNL